MKDPRMIKLAELLVNYSCDVQKGERVLIEATGIPTDFVCALVRQVYARGGVPLVQLNDTKVQREMLMGATEEQLHFMASIEAQRMQGCQAYIGVRGGENALELCDVPSEKQAMYNRLLWSKVHADIRIPKTRWVVLRYPLSAMAQQAGMSTEAFEDFYFDVCTMDYQKMNDAMEALVERMERTDKVHIKGKGTNLRFSIKGMPAIKCAGTCNIPDGEVYSAPVRDSIQGKISYTAKSLYQGIVHENVTLTFKDGKIIQTDGNHKELLEDIFNTDEGARYVGEFAIGVNPYVNIEMLDTLFDEKIAGSFHFTPGNAYDNCFNGNRSAIHWDLVCIQTPAYGGGEIWFDDELIRKDGMFIPNYLHCLNPDALKNNREK